MHRHDDVDVVAFVATWLDDAGLLWRVQLERNGWRADDAEHVRQILHVEDDFHPWPIHGGFPCSGCVAILLCRRRQRHPARHQTAILALDRKSTRLNSSHMSISYAVFCL